MRVLSKIMKQLTCNDELLVMAKVKEMSIAIDDMMM